MKQELLEHLRAMRREVDDVFVPMCGDSEIERDFNVRCREVKRDCLAVIDRKIREVEAL